MTIRDAIEAYSDDELCEAFADLGMRVAIHRAEGTMQINRQPVDIIANPDDYGWAAASDADVEFLS